MTTKRIRFSDNGKITFLSREDCSSMESWEKLLRNQFLLKQQLRALKRKLQNRDKKIEEMQEMLDGLQQQKLSSDSIVEYLQVS